MPIKIDKEAQRLVARTSEAVTTINEMLSKLENEAARSPLDKNLQKMLDDQRSSLVVLQAANACAVEVLRYSQFLKQRERFLNQPVDTDGQIPQDSEAILPLQEATEKLQLLVDTFKSLGSNQTIETLGNEAIAIAKQSMAADKPIYKQEFQDESRRNASNPTFFSDPKEEQEPLDHNEKNINPKA